MSLPEKCSRRNKEICEGSSFNGVSLLKPMWASGSDLGIGDREAADDDNDNDAMLRRRSFLDEPE